MVKKTICKKCGVLISLSRKRRHEERGRCAVQHQRKYKKDKDKIKIPSFFDQEMAMKQNDSKTI